MEKANAAISRRALLKGAGASAVALAGAQLFGPARSQASAAAAEVGGLYALTLGEFDVHLLNDGFIEFPAAYFAANMPPGSAEAVLERNALPAGVVTFPIGVLLARSGGRTVLFDTGAGDTWGVGANNGKLLSSLALAGIDPASVTDLVISHWHPDHVGAIAFADRVSFPNAQLYFPQVDWDFLQGPALGDEFLDGLIAVAKAKLAPMLDRDQVAFYGHEEEIVPGVQALHTPGHSPGHFSFLLSSAGKQLLLTVDVLNHLISLEHPEWFFIYDAVPELAVESRRRLFGRAADERLQIFSNHFPFPGLGYVLRAGEGFHFVPQA